MNLNNFINIAYLAASVLFILGLKGLTSPRTARRGNATAALAMLIAICATLLDHHIVSYEWIFIGITLGSLIGAVAAVKVPLTAMPELVAMFNGFGGGASALVAATAVLAPENVSGVPAAQLYVASAVSAIVGAATLTGSLVAWAKLLEILRLQPLGKIVRLAGGAALLAALRWQPVSLSPPRPAGSVPASMASCSRYRSAAPTCRLSSPCSTPVPVWPPPPPVSSSATTS